MSWFTNWWDALTLLQQCFACVAIPSTIVLILQTLMLIIGFGSHDGDSGEFDQDFDTDHDTDIDHDTHDVSHHDSGIRIMTIRGFVALFAVGGWIGIAMIDMGVSPIISSLTSVAGGIVALLFVAWVFKLFCDMQENGNLNAKNAIARTAKVYIRIPPERSGSGKVTFKLQERFVEMEAVTDSDTEIPTDSMVQVVSVVDDVLVVRPLSKLRT